MYVGLCFCDAKPVLRMRQIQMKDTYRNLLNMHPYDKGTICSSTPTPFESKELNLLPFVDNNICRIDWRN